MIDQKLEASERFMLMSSRDTRWRLFSRSYVVDLSQHSGKDLGLPSHSPLSEMSICIGNNVLLTISLSQ